MKRFITFFLIIGLLTALAGCSSVKTTGTENTTHSANATSTENTTANVPTAKNVVSPQYPQGIPFADFAALSANRNSNPVSSASVNAVQAFSYNTAAPILNTVAVNGCYSPLSLYFALALAGTGANGPTRDELLALLGASDPDRLSQEMSKLFRQLYTDNKISQLRIANSLWLNDSSAGEPVQYKDSFTQNAAAQFYASLFQVDFAQPSAGEAMAQWIADNTNSTLQPRFTPDPEQILSIINTIYFQDEWVDQFKTDDTKPGTFHLADGKDVTCDFMNSVYSSHSFSKGDGYTRSALNLKSNGQMVFVLPDEGVSPQDLVGSPARLKEIFVGGTTSNGKVTWMIPKFSDDSDFKLIDTLKKLGVNAAFAPNADFTGITDHQAFISQITQQTHLTIDENGIVASAFTKIDFAGAAMPVGEAEMILDRPFIYGIFSAPVQLAAEADPAEPVGQTGNLLFVGICGNPVH